MKGSAQAPPLPRLLPDSRPCSLRPCGPLPASAPGTFLPRPRGPAPCLGPGTALPASAPGTALLPPRPRGPSPCLGPGNQAWPSRPELLRPPALSALQPSPGAGALCTAVTAFLSVALPGGTAQHPAVTAGRPFCPRGPTLPSRPPGPAARPAPGPRPVRARRLNPHSQPRGGPLGTPLTRPTSGGKEGRVQGG